MLNRNGGPLRRLGFRAPGHSSSGPGAPVACPVCSCERFDDYGDGINCVCHSCGAVTPWGRLRDLGVSIRELAAPLSGAPELLEPADLVELLEDPDARPYLWDLEA